MKHADLVHAIHMALHQCPLQLWFEYIAGHQDELTHFKNLPLLTQLNVQADFMAKQALCEQGSPTMLLPLPGLQWALSIQNLPVSTNPRAEILSHLSTQMAIPYWISTC